MQKRIAFLTLFLMISALFSFAQDKSKRPSPPAQAECKFPDGNTIHVDYSSPRMRGRKIFGGLVPYNQVWRVGANEATTFVTSANVMVGDKTVPRASYTMFAVPNPAQWL